MSYDSLGDRMKGYEDISRIKLTSKLPVVIRLDGKAFHTYTRGLKRPYDETLMWVMNLTTLHLCNQVQNVKLAYTQSDEISLILVDYADIKTSSWFDNNLQKMVSVAAGMASAFLTSRSAEIFGETRLATFDARAFVLPPNEVNNYLIWRQQDWNRNSLSMLAQSLYSHKELHGKGRAEQHELCFKKGHNWADLSSHLKDGRVAVKRQVEKEISEYKDVTFMGKRLEASDGPFRVVRSEWYIPEITPVFSADREFANKLVMP
jgi:tRNA(His) 5'-end guanylyltransferase